MGNTGNYGSGSGENPLPNYRPTQWNAPQEQRRPLPGEMGRGAGGPGLPVQGSPPNRGLGGPAPQMGGLPPNRGAAGPQPALGGAPGGMPGGNMGGMGKDAPGIGGAPGGNMGGSPVADKPIMAQPVMGAPGGNMGGSMGNADGSVKFGMPPARGVLRRG